MLLVMGPKHSASAQMNDKYRRVSVRRRVACVLLVATLVQTSCSAARAESVCKDKGVSVVVDIKKHRLWLCEADSPVKEFRVSIGRGGPGKRKEGDLRTPLGTYSLGSPRASTRFGVFVPIGYPTDEQSKQGFTGKDVGIHGPERRFRWLGEANIWLDWTEGCIAVATDGAIEEIADWIKAERARAIHVLPIGGR